MNELSSNFRLLQELYKTAREKLSDGVWDYLVGGAGSETTLK